MERPLLIVALFLSTAPVSRAEEDLFVLKGDSVRLDVKKHEEQFRSILWSFNTNIKIVDYNRKRQSIDNEFENGIMSEFDNTNFSLLLKNVQQNYSGIYTATITDGRGQEKAVATYRLTVQEAPPIPQVSVALLSSDGGVCKVLVNCSAEDTWASYTCDHAHCTQVENTTSPTGLNLIVTATNGNIHCSSSNRVATKTQSNSTKDICTPEGAGGISSAILAAIIIGIIIIIGIPIITIVSVILCRRKRRSGGSTIETQCNTEYASVQDMGIRISNAVGTMYDMVTNVRTEAPLEVKTTYETLGPAGEPRQQPESVYATVNKSAP